MPAEGIYVFDACAVIALLHREPGSEVVAEILESEANRCLLHAVNACEIYYDFYRRSGEDVAASVEKTLTDAGFELNASLSPPFWQAAGRLKAVWRRVSLADCFALALTLREQATLVTSDRHEMVPLAEAEACPIRFIR